MKLIYSDFKVNYLKMSAPYFIGSSSPAIAYSPHYAAGYSALSGLKTRVVHKYLPNVPTERNTNNIGYLLPSKRPDGTARKVAKVAGSASICKSTN